MNSQKQQVISFPPQWNEALRNKYTQMSVLQLKKQKVLMVKDLQQINLLLDQMITQQVQQSAKFVQDYDRQIQRTRKLHKSLLKSLINFQFMLTGDYTVKANQQLNRLNNQVKNMKQEVNKFNRMLSIPMQKDFEICQDLQKQVFSLQKQLEQIKIKNHKKKQNTLSNNEQGEKKMKGIKKLEKQLQKLKTQLESQSDHIKTNDSSSQENHNKSYQDLLIKKQKLLNLIQRDEKRFANEYKVKTKKFKELQQTAYQIQLYLHEIQQKIDEKGQELKIARDKNKQIKKRLHSRQKQKSFSSSFKFKKVKTQQNSQIQCLYKKQKYNINLSNINNHNESTSTRTTPYSKDNQQKNNQLLPKLYKALGKSKLQIQQDCNIKDLIY